MTMRVKTTISFLCLAFLLCGGCSKEEETLPPVQIVKVRKPIIRPQPAKDRGRRSEVGGQPPTSRQKRDYVVPRRSEGEEKAEPQKKEDKGKRVPPSPKGYGVTSPPSPKGYGVASPPLPKGYGEEKASSKSRETQPAGARAFKELKKIRFVTTPGGEEKVLIWLNGKFPPHTFSLEGERPRVVCDFFDARLGSNLGRSIKAGGRMIKEIRVGSYKDPKPKVRVVLDLVSRESGDYEVQPIFYKEENIFALVVK